MDTAAALPHFRLPAARPVAARQVKVSIWPIVIVIYATLLPREVRFDFSGLEFYVDRIALMLTLPWVIYKISQRAIRFVLPDWLMLAFGALLIISMTKVYGLERALPSGGALAFDSVAGYYLARISFRSLDDIRRALIVAAPGFFLAGASVMAESISHRFIVRPFFMSIFGAISYTGGGVDVVLDQLRYDVRNGLLRGYGPWPHPILAGLHLATLLPVYWMSGLRGWPKMLGVLAALMAIFTVSSAAVLGLVLAILFIFYDWLTQRVRGLGWSYFLLFAAMALAIIQVSANSGVIGIVSQYATFDNSTAYFRQLIWEYGTQSVWAHPWFGIGLEAYERPDWMVTTSVDNHWLLYAMRYGLPAASAILGATIVAAVALGNSSRRAPLTDARFFRGIAMSLCVLMLMMWSVTLQGGTLTWFTLLLGGCVACAQRSYRSVGITVRR